MFPLRSPLIRSKLCPFFILATWIVAVAVSSPYLFTFELVEYPERNRRNRNVLQMSIAIVTVFVLCWLPNVTNYFITQYQDRSTQFSSSFWIYYEATSYMISAYCAINPVICFMFSSNYRKALKRLIKCSFVQA